MDVNSRDPSQNIIPFRIKGVDIARFDALGNFGIGTTAPTAKLDIAGNVKITGDLIINGTSTSSISSSSSSGVVINMDSQPLATTALNRQKKQSIPLAASSTLSSSDVVAKMSGVSVGKTQNYGVGPAQMASYGNITVAVGHGTNSIAYSLANPPTASSWVGIPNGENTFTGQGRNIAYANGTWVAVGTGANAIAYSTMTPPIASSWIGISSSLIFNGVGTRTTFSTGYDIAYGNGAWVAVGTGTNSIAYSLANPPTAETWVGLPSSAANFSTVCTSITFGNGTWVATGETTNGIAYSIRTPPTADSWVVVPLTNQNDAALNNAFTSGGINIIYANGVWLAAGNGTNVLCYSVENPPIAGSWFPITTSLLFGTYGRSIAYGNGTWVACGESGSLIAFSTSRIPHSSSWVSMKGPTPSSSGQEFNHVSFNAATNTWLFLGDINSNCMFYSTATPPVPATWVGIQRSSGTFTTQAWGAASITTPSFTSPINVARLDNKVTFPANRMLAVGGGGIADVLVRSANTPSPENTGTISFSDDDGMTWQMVPGGATNSMFSSQADISANVTFGIGGSRCANAVAWNGEKWVAAGNGRTNSLAFSDDGGMTWTGVTGKSIFSVEARDVTWNGQMWVAVGRGIAFSTAYSYDGVTWMGPLDASGAPVNVFSYDIAGPSASVSDISGGGNHVIWNGKMWVATGTRTLIAGSSPAAYYTIAYSTDGKTWTGVPDSGATNTGFDVYAHGIAWNGRNFVATGRGTTNTLVNFTDVLSGGSLSSATSSWVGLGNSVFSIWGRGITWGAKRWMATGCGTNTIAYSTNGQNWQGCGANIFKPLRRFMAIGDTGVYNSGTGEPQRGVAISYSDDGVTWDAPIVNQGVELKLGRVPNAFYVRTGGSNWRDYIPLSTANTTANIQTWGPTPDTQFNNVSNGPQNEIAQQFSYFAGYWLNANRAINGQSFSVPVYSTNLVQPSTFTFTATSNYPVTTYNGSLSSLNSGQVYTLTPQTDGITAGVRSLNRVSSIYTNQIIITNSIFDNAINDNTTRYVGLMYSTDAGTSWARVPGSSDTSTNGGTDMTFANRGPFSLAMNSARTRFLVGGGDSASVTRKVYFSNDGFNWRNSISSPNSNQIAWVHASLWVGGEYNRWLIGGSDATTNANSRILHATNTDVTDQWTTSATYINSGISCFAANTDFSIILAGEILGNKIYRSTDGGNSFPTTVSISGTPIGGVNSIAFSPTLGRWVAVGGGGAANTIIYSSDATGTVWALASGQAKSAATAIFKNGSEVTRVIWDAVGGRFIVGGWNGSPSMDALTNVVGFDGINNNPGYTMAYSVDGINWTPITVRSSDDSGLGIGASSFGPFLSRCLDIMALDTNGDYTPVNTGYSVSWNSYANRFVATGNGTTPVVYSNDGGVTWTPANQQPPQQAIVVAGGASAAAGTTTISPLAYTIDGKTWTQSIGAKEIFGTTGAVNAVRYGQTSTAISPNGRIWVAGGTQTSPGTSNLAFSQNGIRWTAIANGTTLIGNVRTIAYAPTEQLSLSSNAITTATSGVGNGVWVAGGDTTNSLIFSYDGISWSEVPNSLTVLTRCNACTFANGLFVVGGAAATGTSAVDTTANMFYSTDGINWRPVRNSVSRISASATIGSIAYGRDENGRGLWVAGAVGSSSISLLYSYNGMDWIGVINSGTTISSINVTGIAYGVSTTTGRGLWVATVHRTTAQGNAFVFSTNGRDGWTPVPNTKSQLFDVDNGGPTGISYLNGVWYATGSSAGLSAGRTLAYSYEGSSGWFGVYPTTNIYGGGVGVSGAYSLTDMRCVATTNDYVIPTGASAGSSVSSGTAATSFRPGSMTTVRSVGWTAGVGSGYLQHPTLLIGSDNSLVGTTTGAISADGGRTWGSSTVSIAQSAFRGGVCNDAFWNGTTWVAVGNDTVTKSKIATSKDGVTWTQLSSTSVPIAGVLNTVTWNGTIWMVGGDGSPINDLQTASFAWSTDLTSWNAISNTDISLTVVKRIAWNGMYWVAVGQGVNTPIMYSKNKNGLVWEDTFTAASSTTKTSALTTMVNDVVWGGGRWVAVGRGNSVSDGSGVSILYSVDTPTAGATSADYAISGRRWVGVAGSAQLFPYGANSIAWNGKRFIATGPASASCSTSNIIAWSADGISWNGYSTSKTVTPGQRWVAVGSGSRACIALSADGRVWTDVSGSALLFSDISGASSVLVNTMKTGARAVGWNGSSLIVGGARSATTVTASSRETANSSIGRTTIPVCAFIGSGNGVMGGGTTNAPMDATAATYLRVTSSVFITHMDVNIRESSAPYANMWLNTYTDLSGTQLFQVTPETQTFSSALKWNGWSWVANFGMTTNNPVTGEQYGSIWYCTDPLARVGWSVASNSANPRILIGQGGYAALEWNGLAWLACGYDPNNNNLIYTTDKYGAVGWTAVSGIVSGAGSASFQPVCIASSSRYWVVGGSQDNTSALYFTSDRTGASGWRRIMVGSVLPAIRISSVAYNGSAWVCCGGGSGEVGAPAASISWRADTGTENILTGWATATISGSNGGIPPILANGSAITFNAGVSSPVWVVVGDASLNAAVNQIAYTTTVDGSTEWKIATGTLTSTLFRRLNGIAWTGYSWIATSGAGSSRLLSTMDITAATGWNSSPTNSIYTPTLCTNAVSFANIPISLLTTGMPTSLGAGAGTGAMWRGGVGRAQGLLTGGGTETTSVIARSANGAEGISWSPVYSRNFLIAVGGGIIRDATNVGGKNRMAYSYDGGLSWTTNNTTVLTNAASNSIGSIRTVKYGNGIWVAGGDALGSSVSGNNCLAWSRDGVNWNGAGGTQIFGSAGSCYAVCCNDRGRWVAVGGSPLTTSGTYTNVTGSIYTMAWSDDGMNWTPILGSRALFGIVCQGVSYGADAAGVGMWTAIGRGSAYTGLAYSYDAKNWFMSQSSSSLFGTSTNVLTERYAPVGPVVDWRTVAINSTGQFQFASMDNGLVYRSIDYGVTWSVLTLPSRRWVSVAVSSTGQYVIAANIDGSPDRLYNSSDYGMTWTGRGLGSFTWKQVAISASGQYQVGVATGMDIVIFRDYGVTYQTPTSGGGDTNNQAVAISSSGQYITVVGTSQYVKQSSDYGVTFIARSINWQWTCIAMSSTGQIQIGSNDNNNIYVSIDYGVNWSASNAPSGNRYRSIAISSTGKYRSGVTESSSDTIKRTNNFDSGWTSNGTSANYYAIAMSATGQYQTAVSGGTGSLIYISSNFGETWSAIATDSRSLGITYGKNLTGSGMWIATAGRRDRDVSANVANTMAYSYDGKLWRGITASAGLSEQAWSVAYGKDGFGVGMWVAAGYDTTCGLKWSYDGINWNASTGASGAAVWASMAAGRRAISVYFNGSMWLASTSDTRNGEPNGTGISANNASSVTGYLLYSYNGKNWLPVLAPNTYDATISTTAQPSIYSVLPNPVILDFGSFYDDQTQRGATIANTTSGKMVSAVASGGVPIENVNTIVPHGRGSLATGQVPFLLGGDSGLVERRSNTIVDNAYDNFIVGPTAQSTNNNWQYFEVNQTRTSATLLTNWQNGNPVIATYGQWDNNRAGDYPFIQKVTGSGTITATLGGGSFTGPALIMHPDTSDANNIGIGYKNNRGNTINVIVNIVLSLLLPANNTDGVNYYIQRGLVNDSRYQIYKNSKIPGKSTTNHTFYNEIELLPNEIIYLILNRSTEYFYDHTKVNFNVTTVQNTSIPITSEIAAATTSLSTSTDGGITWRSVPNSTRVMTKVNKILCDENTQQIVAVGTGNYSVATSTPAKAADADGWTGVFGSRMTDTRAGLFEKYGTGASWFGGAKMWIASGRVKSKSGSSLAVSVNGTVWQDAKIVSQTASGNAGAARGGGLVSRTTASLTTPTIGMNSQDGASAANSTNVVPGNGLYEFSSFTFDSGGKSGPFGPTKTELMQTTKYSSASWTNAYLTVDGGIQLWTVPATGSYTITAGGGYPSIAIQTTTTLTQNDVIQILVGQNGESGGFFTISGGSGGSFVMKGIDRNSSTALLICGGGGGYAQAMQTWNDRISTAATNGRPGSGDAGADSGGVGGTNGGGGAGTYYAQGGAGLNGDGGTGSAASQYAMLPKNFKAGGTGGYFTSGNDARGGFGGGGATRDGHQGGGGGGYSGGGGGGWMTISSSRSGAYGGGGGSYSISGTPTIVANAGGGNGYVQITANFTITTTIITTVNTPQTSYPLSTLGGIVPYNYLSMTHTTIPYTSSTTPLLTYTDSAAAFSTQVSSVATNSQYNSAVVGGSSVQFVAGGRGGSSGLAYSNDGQNWTAASAGTGTNAVFQSPTNATTRTGSGGFDASFGTVALTQRLTTPTTYPSGSWTSISVSKTGQYQTATITSGFIYTSSDYGVNWTTRGTSASWDAISISSSGQYQTVANKTSGFIFTSTDYGVTWTQRFTSLNGDFQAISISSTGQYQAAVIPGGYTYRSSDYGVNWTAYSGIGHASACAMAISSTGQYQTTSSASNGICMSSDYGVTFTVSNTSITGGNNRIAMSSNGQYRTTYAYGGTLYTSSDYGISWTSRNNNRSWYGISMSSTGQYQSASVNSSTTTGFIYTSSDFGITWTARNTDTNRTWYGISVSGTGQYQSAVVNGGNIWTSSNYGVNWVQRSTGTRTNTFNRIKSSASGQYQIATSGTEGNANGQLYVSTDYGQTWMPRRGLGQWLSGSVSASGALMMGIFNASVKRWTFTKLQNGDGYAEFYSIPANNSVSMTFNIRFTTNTTVINSNLNGGWQTEIIVTDIHNLPNPSTIYFSFDIVNGWKIEYTVSGISKTVTLPNRLSITSIDNINNTPNSSYGSKATITGPDYPNSTILRSTDYGNTFSDIGGTTQNWKSISTTNSASVQGAVSYGSIYRSFDSGLSWTNAGITIDGSANANTITPQNWQNVAISAETGNYQVACVNNGYMYYSTNRGDTWTSSSVNIDGVASQSISRVWKAITNSANGQYAIACVNSTTTNGYLYRSENFGATWVSSNIIIDSVGLQTTNRPWQDVAISANGKYQVACINSNTQSSSSSLLQSAVSIMVPPPGAVVSSYGTTWTQRGQDIDGEVSGDQSGYSISLSADGSVVAIGAPYNAGASGIERGHVRVYALVGGVWTKRGNDIDGGANYDQFGISVSISASGNTVAVGAPYYDLGGISNRGQVLVYDWTGGPNWVQRGSNIMYGEGADDYSGMSVSLSKDGNVVAIGAPMNNRVSNFIDSGHVRVYRWNTATSAWVQRGADIDGGFGLSSSGSSVNKTANTGSRNWSSIAMSYSGQYQTGTVVNGFIYVSNNYGLDWIERATSQPWRSVSMSANGQFQTAVNNDTLDTGSGTLYCSSDYGLTWTQKGYSTAYSSVAVSGTGQYQIATYYYALVTSSDYGETWGNPVMYINGVGITDKKFRSVAISYNGAIRAVVGYTLSNIYISYDYGSTWVSRSNAPNYRNYIKMSSTGQYMIASGQSDYFEWSADFGETWTSYNFGGNGGASAISPDGTVAVHVGTSYLYSLSPASYTGIPNVYYHYGSSVTGIAISEKNGLTAQGKYATIAVSTVPLQFSNNFFAGNTSLNYDNVTYVIDKGDQSGTSVSLSADGSVVAIGAPYSDNANIIDRGQVCVWYFDTVAGAWTKRGDDIFGEGTNNQSGFSVSMSADGNTVAIGAPYNNGANGTDSGHVRVYKWNGSAWLQAGTLDIDGEAGLRLISATSSQIQTSSNRYPMSISKLDGKYQTTIIYTNSSNYIYTSSNYGVTWTTRLSTGVADCVYKSITMSDNGQIQYAGTDSPNCKIYKSTNYGVTWTEMYYNSNAAWEGVATNSDGKYVSATTTFGSLYRSQDYGANWTTANFYDGNRNRYWKNISMSSNGAYQLAAYESDQGNGGVYMSNDYGANWSAVLRMSSPTTSFYGAAVSATGKYMIASAWGARFYVSNNYGSSGTWTEITSEERGTLATNYYVSAAISGSGRYMSVATTDGYVFINRNFGLGTWQARSITSFPALYSTNMTLDGQLQVVVGGRQKLFWSYTYGYDWTDYASYTSADSGDRSGYSISISADGNSIAVGAPYNDGTSGMDRGQLRVFDYNTTNQTWPQRGTDNDGEASYDLAGWSVSMSADGTTVAFGAPMNDGAGNALQDSGSVRVFNTTVTNPITYTSSNSSVAEVFSNLIVIKGDGTTNITSTQLGTTTNGTLTTSGTTYLLTYTTGTLSATSYMYYSKNYGVNWSILSSAGSRAWSSVALSENGSTISATTSDATGGVWVYAMPDDQYYQQATLTNSGSNTITSTVRAIAYGNSGTGAAIDGYWVAGADASANTLAYSSNGIDWTAVLGSKTTLFNSVNGVAYGSDSRGTPMWVAVGLPFVGSVPGVSAYSIAYSYNMTTWIGVHNTSNFTGQGNHVSYGQDEYGEGIWIAVGQSDGILAANLGNSSTYNSNGTTNTTIFYSYDGANWSAATGDGVFAVSGTDVTWGVDASGVPTWVATGVGYTNPLTGVFIPGGCVAYSTNGRVWTPIRNLTSTGLSATTLPATTRGHAMLAPPSSTGFIIPTYNNIWRMMGGDIDGEGQIEYSGISVSISADGTVVAIGANQNDGSGNNAGHVRVYKYNPNKTVAQMNQALPGFGPAGWDRLGGDIDGEQSEDQSGISVCLSADGTTVAIGARLNDGTTGSASDNRGHVRVYRYRADKTAPQFGNTSATATDFGPAGWDRLGGDIDGEALGDNSGIRVSISADGNIIAIAASENDGSGNVPNSGHVRVYKYTQGKGEITDQNSLLFGPVGWVRLGADIDGEAASDGTLASPSMISVALSADGSTVAIGAPGNDATNLSTDSATGQGHVRVYKYDANKMNAQMTQGSANFGPRGWNRLGTDIDGLIAQEQSGTSVSLSADGTILAIGSPNPATGAVQVRIFSWNSTTWVQRGGSISGETTDDRSGTSVSLSADGNILAIGAPYNDVPTTVTADNRGHVRVYKYNAGKTAAITDQTLPNFGPVGWDRIGVDIDGEAPGDESGTSVSISADGTTLAIGSITNDGGGNLAGQVRVYKLDTFGAITYTSSNPAVAEIYGNAILLIKDIASGTTTITATQSAVSPFSVTPTIVQGTLTVTGTTYTLNYNNILSVYTPFTGSNASALTVAYGLSGSKGTGAPLWIVGGSGGTNVFVRSSRPSAVLADAWSVVASNAEMTNAPFTVCNSIGYSNGIWVAGNNTDSINVLARSDDGGITWKPITAVSTTGIIAGSTAIGANAFCNYSLAYADYSSDTNLRSWVAIPGTKNFMFDGGVNAVETVTSNVNVSYYQSTGNAWWVAGGKNQFIQQQGQLYLQMPGNASIAYTTNTNGASGWILGTSTVANGGNGIIDLDEIRDIAFSPHTQQWLAVGVGSAATPTRTVLYSANGIAWTSTIVSSADASLNLNTCVWNQLDASASAAGRWLVGGTRSGSDSTAISLYISTETTGQSWTPIVGTGAILSQVYSLAYNGRVWIAAGTPATSNGSTSTLMRTTDPTGATGWQGIANTNVSTGGFDTAARSITWNADQQMWVATGENTGAATDASFSSVIYSLDVSGSIGTWRSVRETNSFCFSGEGTSIAFKGDKWFAAGQGTNQIVTTTGASAANAAAASWTPITHGTSITSISDIAYTGRRLIATGASVSGTSNGVILTTDNSGSVWTAAPATPGPGFSDAMGGGTSITFEPSYEGVGRAVATGRSAANTISVSTDGGVSWSDASVQYSTLDASSSAITQPLFTTGGNSVAYVGNDTLFAGGGNDVQWTGKRWVATGRNSATTAASVAATRTTTASTSAPLQDVINNNTSAVAISDDGITWQCVNASQGPNITDGTIIASNSRIGPTPLINSKIVITDGGDTEVNADYGGMIGGVGGAGTGVAQIDIISELTPVSTAASSVVLGAVNILGTGNNGGANGVGNASNASFDNTSFSITTRPL